MCLKSYRNQILFLATGPKSIQGGGIFLKKEIFLSKFFVAKTKKTLAIKSPKLLHTLYIC